MKYTKRNLLEKAVKITEEYARGGGSLRPEAVLDSIYKKLKELNEELDEE